MVGFHAGLGHFLTFVLIVVLLNNVASSYVVMIGSFAANFQVGNAISAIVIVLQMLFGGFFSNIATIPVWLRWLQWVSVFKYGFEVLAINEFDGLTFDCPPAPEVCQVPDGDVALKNLGFNKDHFAQDMIILFALMMFYRLVAYYFLRRQAQAMANALTPPKKTV
eukprot:GFYU01029007.1.p1 GENE.GFYU01029007.1~~GFYU01029007.1.p1  ORF type:complete len:165 (-),score=42.70 GFYU01029007.1:228-722(-)